MREEIILADDMSEHPVTPQQEQEIATLVAKPMNATLQAELELERRKAIYRALMIGYTVKEELFDNIPKAQRVLPNPRNKKPQEPLTPEQERRLARIKKDLRKR